MLRIKFRGEKKRCRDLVLLSREDPADVATRILAAVLLGEPGIMDLAERFTSVKSFESENPIDIYPIMDVDHCALPYVPSLSRDQGAYFARRGNGNSFEKFEGSASIQEEGSRHIYKIPIPA